MKRFYLSLCGMLLFTPLQAQTTLFDSIYNIVRQKSIYSAEVDWDSVHQQVYREDDLSRKDSIDAIFPAFERLLHALHDMHSFIQYKDKMYGNPDAGAYNWQHQKKDIVAAARNDNYVFRTQLLDKNYAYIAIPPVLIAETEDEQKALAQIGEKAQSIADSLCKLQPGKLKGLVVDLRLNSGGSTVAILGGLAPLLPEGKNLTFLKNEGGNEELTFKEGRLSYNGQEIVRLKSSCKVNPSLKIAVLISGYTRSGGEHAAICFKGSRHTRFFGQTTGGLITGNETLFLRKDLILTLSTAYAADKTGQSYKRNIVPDVVISEESNFENLRKDKTVITALDWLKQ